jgi:hypothetical protein
MKVGKLKIETQLGQELGRVGVKNIFCFGPKKDMTPHIRPSYVDPAKLDGSWK